MKILILILTLFIKDIDTVKFENLIGEKLSKINLIMDTNFKNDLSSNKNLYFASFNSYKEYYGMSYNMISTTVDKNNTITSLTIHFKSVINRNFFDLFNTDYNIPDKIYITGDKTITSDDKYGNHHLVQGELEIREGTFDEKPLLIFWNKKKYQIKVLNREGFLQTSDLTYRLPTDQF